jgi:hypothetical protein
MSDFEPIALKSGPRVRVWEAFDAANRGDWAEARRIGQEIRDNERFRVECRPWANDFLLEIDRLREKDPYGDLVAAGQLPYPQYYR